MLTNTFSKLYERDLNKLITEINLYESEEDLWKTADGINNSAGNLALHLIGNLKTYIGKNLGNYIYERNRPAEFSLKNVPRETIIADMEVTKNQILDTLIRLSSDDYEKIYSENVLGYEMTTEYFLIHLNGHLNYHLGQINYHRRLLSTN
jgi:Protein of unknown function (DUF1572)